MAVPRIQKRSHQHGEFEQYQKKITNFSVNMSSVRSKDAFKIANRPRKY